ncbi:hypothetical protein NBO_7g0029 [Nosema bombycis CQ1]|uniref:Uncharacterized protein n=1 Tax=Nosema bombycis (strain CQ1 / CVCC 102059) TaxID=578461 RepID=R0KWD0_NOSB1|nr:hypothetical protein NBO_7g0029 [Nosema bombycis CQ1]|eukprot:EOB15211.1 hypothetical protein NBO_7g0029 [Nosema bombycis CQ1]
MILLDLFYNVLAETDDLEKASEIVKKELLKRKVSLVKSQDTYEYVKMRYENLLELEKKVRKVKELKN